MRILIKRVVNISTEINEQGVKPFPFSLRLKTKIYLPQRTQKTQNKSERRGGRRASWGQVFRSDPRGGTDTVLWRGRTGYRMHFWRNMWRSLEHHLTRTCCTYALTCLGSRASTPEAVGIGLALDVHRRRRAAFLWQLITG